MAEFASILQEKAVKAGFDLNDRQLRAFTAYYDLLIDWNSRMNLTAITEPDEVAVKHMVDSLSCYCPEFFPGDCTVIDVGAGAGFPGLPLKIFRPDLKLTMLDSLNKRVGFLNEVVAALSIQDAMAVHARAEEAARRKDMRESFYIAVSRAVARLNILCELCLPFVAVGGHFIALKGAQYQDEIAEAKTALAKLGGEISDVKPIILPGLTDKRAVIYINKVAPTPQTYPRRPGMAEKKPL